VAEIGTRRKGREVGLGEGRLPVRHGLLNMFGTRTQPLRCALHGTHVAVQCPVRRPSFAPACAGRGGRGYAPHWAVSGTQNIALKVITSSRFRALTIYRRVGAPAYSPKCVAWGFSEVAYLRTSYEAVPPALALPEMKPERVPITVVTTVSRV
jgi:hypothetical protein